MSLKTVYDVFVSKILKNVVWCGVYDFPKLKPCTARPRQLVSFDHARFNSNLGDTWIDFYVHDRRFRPVLKTPEKYAPYFKTYAGLIGLDCSMYRDLPKARQIHSVYCNRLTDAFWQQNGINVIPNVSWADHTSFPWCCDGIAPNSTVAISSYGCIRDRIDRSHFLDGVFRMAEVLRPKTIVHHGTVLPDVERCARENGFEIIRFSPRIRIAHERDGV